MRRVTCIAALGRALPAAALLLGLAAGTSGAQEAAPDPRWRKIGLAAFEAGAYAEAAPLLEAFARRRDADARFALGVMHLDGLIADADPNEGRLLVTLAATEGHARAAARLGDVLRTGEAGIRDPRAAGRWYREALAGGAAEGALGLGIMLRDGLGGRADPAEAARYFAIAAEADIAAGHCALATMLERGLGAPRNIRRARDHYMQAAALGDALARRRLGEMSLAGVAAPRDPVEAVRWFRGAAEEGDAAARIALAEALAAGEGAPRDFVEAYAWSNLAAAAGLERGAELRDALARRMNADEVTTAEQRSEEILRGAAGASAGAPAGTAGLDL